MKYYETIQELIGNTPMLKINHPEIPNSVQVFAKLEFLNPGGSIKDRLGKVLIQEAISKGKISSRGTIIEPTAGNTGIGLALAAVGTEVKIICVTPEKFSQEKQTLMRALGATVVNTPTKDGMSGAILKAEELQGKIMDSYIPQQFENVQNPNTYYESLAPEIYSELEGKVDIFVAGAGSGGTFTGVAKYLKEKSNSIRTVIVEPEGSILNGGEPGSHYTEGIGLEFIPKFVDTNLFDEIYTIYDIDAFKRVRELAKHCGLLVGSSSGAAFDAAIQEAKLAKPNTNIVTIFPDGSERYLSRFIYEEDFQQ